ncbi:MAG: META domain-containing protein [Actinomycetota bacterium]
MTPRRLVAAIALVLVACSGSGDQLVGPTWVLDPWSIARLGIEVPAGTIVDLRFEGTELGGTSACNHYGGPYEAGSGSVRLGDIAVTARACEDASLMGLESAYLEAFSKVDGWRIQDGEGGRPSLKLTGGGVELRYTAVDEPSPSA